MYMRFPVSGRNHNAVSSCGLHRGDLIRSHEGIRQVFEEVIVVERCSEGCFYSRGTTGQQGTWKAHLMGL